MKQLPFYLTLSRIVGAPFLGVVFFFNEPWAWWLSFCLFIALSITDYFDGMLARKYNVVSDFGKFFDPTGDKILVLFALVILLHLKALDPYVVLVLLCRDIFIGTIRSYAATTGLVIAARSIGKWKTGFQMVAIPLMLAPIQQLLFIPTFLTGHLLLWVAAALSIWSLIDYTLILLKNLQTVEEHISEN